MQKVLRKRVLRDLKKNFFRYFALGLMIAMGIFLVVTIVGSGETLTKGTEDLAEKTNLEDGEFEVFVPLSKNDKNHIADMGIDIEEHFYYDYKNEDDTTVRIFKVRKNIDKIYYIEGSSPKKDSDIVLEKRYAEEHDLSVGDTYELAGKNYTVSGIGVVSDYDGPFKEISDTSCNSITFGLAFITDDAYQEFKNSGKTQKSEEYLYAYKLGGGKTDADLKEYLKEYKDGISDYTDGVDELYDGLDDMADGVADMDESVEDALEEFDFELSNLTMFLKYEDNPRIYATKNDKVVDIEVGIIAGVVIFILLAYVISVFVVHSIESESSIIGTLYSMGVTKNDLLTHYITLPVVVTFIAGLLGALAASTGILAPMIAESSYAYFSIPVFTFHIPLYLWVYSVAVPPIVAVIVNVLVIRSKLNRTALSLIRNESKQKGIKKINLKGMNFVSAFRIRQMLREMRSTLAVVLGMFLSLLVFMIAVNCFVLCTNIAKDYKEDTKFEYMYNLKYPEEEVPEGGEAAYAYTCKKNAMGFNFDVTILGIDKENPYFDVTPGDSKTDIVVSSSFAEKFGLKIGEEFVVTDDDKDLKYAFSVKEIADYSTGFYIFMDIDEMRDMMGESDDYYNVVFSDKELDIDPGRIYSITTREDIVKGSSVFTSLMMPMIYVISFASAIIFCVVMYLMMKVMIDRSAYNISLIKVFGYKRKEIRKLYLDGNFYIIAIGALICLPLAKLIMNKMFPFMISNVSCGLNVKAPISFFVVTYIVILLLYFIINAILVSRLNKFTPAEVLKNRE